MIKQINFETLSLQQRIGQLFFIGLPGTIVDDKTRELLDHISPGGICLFTRNIKSANQTRELLDEVRKILPVEPFLALDQEGGLVDRLRRIVTPMAAVKNLTAKGDSLCVEKLAELTGEIVRILGFNLNFAPVVDVIDEKREKFVNGLYSRGFGKNTSDVVNLAGRYLAKLQATGCLGTIKHFPGYGATEVDSHEELPKVNLTLEELLQKDLVPYQKFFAENNVFCVMVGHAAYPRTDLQETDDKGNYLPSSLSRNFINKLLRDRFNYQNLVITDDLEMGAIIKNYGMGEAAKMALKAGNDQLLICASTDAMTEAFDAVCKAVEAGEISLNRIEKSLERIERIKSKLSPPLEFNEIRIGEISVEIKKMNDMC
ncbi:MAG: glycoside hydrolase family 3 N-terminal domain-containing protein [Pyrinomonadaceae bacterium]